MTASRRPNSRARDAVLALIGAGVLVLTSACASASDLADGGSTSPSTEGTEAPLRKLPPTEGTTPTPAPTATTPPVAAPPKTGECRKPSTVDFTLRITDDEADPIRCAGATSVTYLVRKMPRKVKTAVTAYKPQQIVATSRSICEKGAVKWLGADMSTYKHSQFDFIVGVPSASESAKGASWMRCDLVLPATNLRAGKLPKRTKNALKGKKANKFMQCVRGNIAQANGTVPCTTKHQWRGVGSVKLGTGKAKYPGMKKVTATMKSRCGTVVRSYLNTRSSFQYGYISPSRPMWNRGERWGVCYAKTKN